MRDVQQSRRSDRTFRKPFEWLTSDQQHQLLWAARHCRTDVVIEQLLKIVGAINVRFDSVALAAAKYPAKNAEGRPTKSDSKISRSTQFRMKSRAVGVFRDRGERENFGSWPPLRSVEVYARSPWEAVAWSTGPRRRMTHRFSPKI